MFFAVAASVLQSSRRLSGYTIFWSRTALPSVGWRTLESGVVKPADGTDDSALGGHRPRSQTDYPVTGGGLGRLGFINPIAGVNNDALRSTSTRKSDGRNE